MSVNVGFKECLGAGESLPDLDVPPAIDARPHAQHVLALPHAQHDPADLLAGVAELVAHDAQQQILPVAVGDALLQAHDPLAAALVGRVLPHGPHALAEQVVVGHGRQRRRPLQVRVHGPEGLRAAERRQRHRRLLVVGVLGRRRPVPHHPAVLGGVLGRRGRGGGGARGS